MTPAAFWLAFGQGPECSLSATALQQFFALDPLPVTKSARRAPNSAFRPSFCGIFSRWVRFRPQIRPAGPRTQPFGHRSAAFFALDPFPATKSARRASTSAFRLPSCGIFRAGRVSGHKVGPQSPGFSFSATVLRHFGCWIRCRPGSRTAGLRFHVLATVLRHFSRWIRFRPRCRPAGPRMQSFGNRSAAFFVLEPFPATKSARKAPISVFRQLFCNVFRTGSVSDHKVGLRRGKHPATCSQNTLAFWNTIAF